MQRIYFDNAATTQLHPKVKEKVIPFLYDHFGNPSSIHSYGREVRVAIEDARETVAGMLNADPSEIYFTSGGTEANNFAIRGISKTVYEETGRRKVLTSKADHHAVLDTVLQLNENGHSSFALECDTSSRLDLESLAKNCDNHVALVAAIHINNETGSQNNVSSIAEIVKPKGALLHIDAVQSYGKFDTDVQKLGVDTLAASGHKIHGLKGTGILYAKSGTPLSALIVGGPQERNRRGGTENVPGIIAFAEASKVAKEYMEENYSKVSLLKKYFTERLNELFDDKVLINSSPDSSPYILSVTFKSDFLNNDAEAMLMFHDLNGVAASNGAACTSGTLKPSHVLSAMGFEIEDAQGTVRYSFNPQNTMREVDYVIEVLKKMELNFAK